MRLYQTWKDYLAQVLLLADVPVVTDLTRRRLVDIHAEFFLERSERHHEQREPHFRALFDASMDVYVRASREGYPEAEARELAHILATWNFQNHGWGDLIEFPPEEREAYYERYQKFCDRYGTTPADPLGEFAPAGGLPDAPETPDRMNGEYPIACPGFADGVYTLAPDLDRRFRAEEGMRGEAAESTVED